MYETIANLLAAKSYVIFHIIIIIIIVDFTPIEHTLYKLSTLDSRY